jgi:heptosyltransferase-2
MAATADKADKKWPGFEAFARAAEARLGLPLVVYPGPGEHEAARRLYPDARMLEGSDLAVYAALLHKAALVVANDTGPGHMAAALGRPLISLLGPTEAARWAPWGSGVTVLQRPRIGTATDWPDADEALALAQRLLARP